MDREKMKQGITLFLEGLGVELDSNHFRETPQRVVNAWADELCVGLKDASFTLKTFPLEEGDAASMVILQNIPVKSLCAHHLLPFVGTATVAYIPNRQLCGLSKLSRVVNFLSRKPQVQEHLTSEVARYLEKALDPLGVGVVIRASHFCMEMRGVNHSGKMTTSALHGCFLKDPTRSEFMSLVQAG